MSVGKPVTAADLDKRHLLAPTARVAFPAIETIDDFAERPTATTGILIGLHITHRQNPLAHVANNSYSLTAEQMRLPRSNHPFLGSNTVCASAAGQARWAKRAVYLGTKDLSRITVVGDGAERI